MENVFGTDPDSWINALPSYKSSVIHELLQTGKSYDDIIDIWLSQRGHDNTFQFGAGSSENWSSAVKQELAKILCGDEKYDSVRKEIYSRSGTGKDAVIYYIAWVLHNEIGLAAITAAPVVATAIAAAAKFGVSVWCSQNHPQTQ